MYCGSLAAGLAKKSRGRAQVPGHTAGRSRYRSAGRAHAGSGAAGPSCRYSGQARPGGRVQSCWPPAGWSCVACMFPSGAARASGVGHRDPGHWSLSVAPAVRWNVRQDGRKAFSYRPARTPMEDRNDSTGCSVSVRARRSDHRAAGQRLPRHRPDGARRRDRAGGARSGATCRRAGVYDSAPGSYRLHRRSMRPCSAIRPGRSRGSSSCIRRAGRCGQRTARGFTRTPSRAVRYALLRRPRAATWPRSRYSAPCWAAGRTPMARSRAGGRDCSWSLPDVPSRAGCASARRRAPGPRQVPATTSR